MLFRTPPLVLAVLLGHVILFPEHARAQQPVPNPGMAPQFGIATTADDGTIELHTCEEGTIYQTVQSEVTAAPAKRPAKRPFNESGTENDMKRIVRRIAPTDVEAIRVDGTRVNQASLMKLIAKPTPVLLAQRGREINKAFLRIVKPDTLILVLPKPAPTRTASPLRAPAHLPSVTTVRDPEPVPSNPKAPR